MKINSIRNIKIHSRLIFSLVILTLVPMIVTSILTYHHSKNAFESKISSYSEQLVKAATEKINSELQYIESISEELSMENSIQDFLVQKEKLTYLEYYKIRNDVSQKFLEKMRLSTLSLSSDITSINIILDDKAIIGAGQNNYNYEQLYMMYKLTANSKEKFSYKIISDLSGYTEIAIGMNVTNHRTGEYVGVMLITFKESYISNTIFNLNLGNNVGIFVVSKDNIIVSTNQPDNFKKGFIFHDLSLLKKIQQSNNNANNVTTITYKNKNYISISQMIKSSKWTIITFIPMNFVQYESKLLMWFILIIGLLCVGFSLPIALLISNSIEKPILRLKKQMVLATIGNLNVEIQDNGTDEIAEMTNSFNVMITTLRNLIIENKDENKEIIYKLGEIIEAKSKETGNHVYRVAHFSQIIGNKLGINGVDSETLKIASILHDIGKISIPDHILIKPGKLTKEEFELIKTHTTVGHSILSNSRKQTLKMAAIIALEHHERYDGTGYPNGCSGDETSIYSRIVALADVFDALCSKRSYKEAWEMEEILKYIQEHKGSQFDPDVVDAFFECLPEIVDIKDNYQD